LVDALEHFKEKDGAVDKSAPAGFLDPEERAAANKDGKFRVSLYKESIKIRGRTARR